MATPLALRDLFDAGAPTHFSLSGSLTATKSRAFLRVFVFWVDRFFLAYTITFPHVLHTLLTCMVVFRKFHFFSTGV